MFSIGSRTPLASPSFKQAFAHARAFPFNMGHATPSMAHPGSPLFSPAPYSSHFLGTPGELTPTPSRHMFFHPEPTPPLRVPAVSNMIAHDHSMASYFSMGATPTRGRSTLDGCLKLSKPPNSSTQGKERAISKHKARRSLKINLVPTVITDVTDIAEHLSYTTIEDNLAGQVAFKSSKKRNSTPHPGKKAWIEEDDDE